jgi:hypothetical protein
MDIKLPKNPQFNKYYTKHCKYLKLKGLQPKTIEAYARALMGRYSLKPPKTIRIPNIMTIKQAELVICGNQKIKL